MKDKPPLTSRTTLLVMLDSNRMMAGPSRYDTPQYMRATLAVFDRLQHEKDRTAKYMRAEVERLARQRL